MYVAELVKVAEVVELFEQAKEVLWGLLSEIDNRTCDFCRDVHGKTLTQDEVITTEAKTLGNAGYVDVAVRPNIHTPRPICAISSLGLAPLQVGYGFSRRCFEFPDIRATVDGCQLGPLLRC